MVAHLPDVQDRTGDDAAAVLARAGLPPGPVLGAGVEGTVVDVGRGLVAKVWRRRPVEEVRRLADFHAAVAAARPAVATPRIERVLEVDGRVVSVEARLAGEPLWVADGSSPRLGPREVDAVLTALTALAGVPGTPPLRRLPVLPGEPPLAGAAPFERELAGLVARRAGRSHGVLSRHLPHLDEVLGAVLSTLRSLPPAAPTLVHGDLIAANILADHGRASAVLDFGFLTTAGDPAFDAAVTASCFDMYGPRAAEVERLLDTEIRATFGYADTRLATYRAAYALATATLFVPPGSTDADGHLLWCVATLERPDILEALDLPRR